MCTLSGALDSQKKAALQKANVVTLLFDELTDEIFDATFVVGASYIGADCVKHTELQESVCFPEGESDDCGKEEQMLSKLQVIFAISYISSSRKCFCVALTVQL